MNNLTKAVSEEPHLWGHPEFINLRNFVEVVPNNPTKFPMESNSSKIVHKEVNGMSLSLNFGNKIESG